MGLGRGQVLHPLPTFSLLSTRCNSAGVVLGFPWPHAHWRPHYSWWPDTRRKKRGQGVGVEGTHGKRAGGVIVGAVRRAVSIKITMSRWFNDGQAISRWSSGSRWEWALGKAWWLEKQSPGRQAMFHRQAISTVGMFPADYAGLGDAYSLVRALRVGRKWLWLGSRK